MPIEVTMTRPAADARDRLHRQQRRAYDSWLADLRSNGCAAMGYRMHGELVERLCVKHLGRNLRAIVAFPSPISATIVLLGPHDDKSPLADVYTQLYELAGITPPEGNRTKPACCGDDGGPPEGSEVASELADRIHLLAKARRRR